MHNNLNNEYFAWLYQLVCGNRYSNHISYKSLLTYLYDTDFRYSILRDENRAEDGLELRHRFEYEYDYYPDVNGPCSVLEMIVALAIRCEETIMDDPHIGNRTSQWFWVMITNLGLGSMNDSRFDGRVVKDIIERFLDREYEPDGSGGLFKIQDCEYDLRDVEIWHQLCWYLDSIT